MVRMLFMLVALAGLSPAQQHLKLTTQDGGVVHANVYGKGKRGIVLAHGGLLTKESWAKQAQILAAAGFRVIAIDFRGFGESRVAGQTDSDTAPHHLDVLAAVRYLRKAGARTVSLVGGSFGGVAAARITADLKPGEIDRLVLLAAQPDVPPEKLPGPKLFIVARDDANSAGLRLPGIRAYYEKALESKQWMTIDGDSHAQFIFQTDQGDRVMAAILRFLTGK